MRSMPTTSLVLVFGLGWEKGRPLIDRLEKNEEVCEQLVNGVWKETMKEASKGH